VLLRHAIIILAGSAVVVLSEPLLLTGSTPLITGLADPDQVTLYNDVIVVSAGLLGFFVAAVAILVSLDRSRRVVAEIQQGGSFELLVANMLATIALLFTLTLLGISGAVFENGQNASPWFDRAYEWVALASIAELLMSGFYFSVVMYKVAQHRPPADGARRTDGDWADSA